MMRRNGLHKRAAKEGSEIVTILQRTWRSTVAGIAGGLALLYGSTAFGMTSAATSKTAFGHKAPAAQSSATPRASMSLSAVKAGSIKASTIRALMAGEGYASFVQGSGPVHLTVFIDPNCIYCHLFWEHLTKTQDWKSKYTIRWVPLGFLKPSSRGKAGAILNNGAKGLTEDETNFNVESEEGAIAQTHERSLLKKVKANTMRWARNMKSLGVEAGTPTIVTGDGRVFAGLVPLSRLGKADKSDSATGRGDQG